MLRIVNTDYSASLNCRNFIGKITECINFSNSTKCSSRHSFCPPFLGGGSIHAGAWSGDPGAVCVSGGEPADPARDHLHHWPGHLQDTLSV